MEAGQSSRLSQVAMSVCDLRKTHQWYIDVFAFEPGGGTESFKGWGAEKVQGLPGASSTCWWLLDKQDFFQLELFEFKRPKAKPAPPDRSRADIGYAGIGIHVDDFDATLQRAAAFGSPPLSDAAGEPGRRRVCVRDPEGLFVEIMEDDPRQGRGRLRPRQGVPSVLRSITVSVPKLERSRTFFIDGLGCEEAPGLCLHGSEHEKLWGLEGARSKSLLLWAGDILVELVEYLEPSGRPRPGDYKISDQGLLNIAFGFRKRSELNRVLRSARAAGARPNFPVMELGNWGVVYVNDPQGFSVELLYVRPYWDRRMGFAPAPADCCVSEDLVVNAAPELLWERIVDHENMSSWWPCQHSKLLEEGEGRNGPGALREIRDGRSVLRERITAWEPGRRLDYRLLSGAPLKYHFGRFFVEDASGGRTRLRYSIRFAPKIPGSGWLLQRVVGGMLSKALAKLKVMVESEARALSP